MASQEDRQIIRVADAAALAQTAAEIFQQAAQENIAAHGHFTVALSGGSTPKAMFALLAREPYRSAIDWAHVYVFWGDERCVPPDHPDSNFRMTKESLLDQVPLPPANIFRIAGVELILLKRRATMLLHCTGFSRRTWPQFDRALGWAQTGTRHRYFRHCRATG
ncbi:MAG: 6-phosphogluconolactonase [Blastocatellia bacterium]